MGTQSTSSESSKIPHLDAAVLPAAFHRSSAEQFARKTIDAAELGAERLPARAALAYRDASVTPDEMVTVIPRLTRVLAANPDVLPINISDFDGTLIRDSSGFFKIDYAIDRNFLDPVIRPKLDTMLALFGLAPQNDRDPLLPESIGSDVRLVKEAFENWLKLPGIPAEERHSVTREFYQMCSWIFAGHTPDEMRTFAEAVLVETGYGGNYFAGSRDVIKGLDAIGVRTGIVSATFQPVVEVAARYFGIEPRYVIGMNLEIGPDGRYLPEMAEPVTFREGKVAAAELLMQRLLADTGRTAAGRLTPLLAMGDSPAKTDEQLLALAKIAVAVEPQTPKDAESARSLFSAGRLGFFLDFERTIDGGTAEKFRRELDEQVLPAGKFL